jgi:hypothetical protein
VDVQAAVLCEADDARWDEEAEGDRYHEVDVWQLGTVELREAVDLVDGEVEGLCDFLDGD